MNKAKNAKNTKKPRKGVPKQRQQPRQGNNIPSAYVSRSAQIRGPTIQRGRSGDARILVVNEEYLTDVICAAQFTVTSYAINPALGKLFPWLSPVASAYEFYHFRRLSFHYRPQCSTANSGAIMLGVDFDAADVAPVNKQRFMSYLGANQGACFAPLHINCAASNLSKVGGGQRYTRSGAVPAGKDVKLYDIGNLHVATQGGLGAATGSIYISYEVELMTPHSPATFPWEESGALNSTVCNVGAPLLGATAAVGDVADPIIEIVDNQHFLLKKAGEYLVTLQATGTGLTAAAFNQIFTGNIETSPATALVNSVFTQYMGLGKLRTSENNVMVTVASAAAWATLSAFRAQLSPYGFAL